MPNELAELKAKLDAINGDALAVAEKQALRAMGDLVLAAIKTNAPVRTEQHGGDLEPGELKAGFKVTVHIATDSGTTTGDTSRVIIGPNAKVAHVARFIEDGHANARYTGANHNSLPNTPARPFVRPAFDETEQAAINLYTSTLTDAIQKALA